MAGRTTLFAHRAAPPGATGVHRFVREVALELARTSPGGRAHELVTPWTHEEVPWADGQLPVVRLPGHHRLTHVAWTLVRQPALEVLRARSADRPEGRPDLVHVLYPSTPVPSRAPQVWSVHDLMPIRHPEWYSSREVTGFRRAMAWVADHAAAVVVPATVIADEVEATLGIERSRLRIVPYGIARSVSTPTEASLAARPWSGRRYVVALGAVEARKNLPLLVRALALLAPPDDLDLVLVGPPRDGVAAVEAEVARLGLEGRVHLAGFVTDAEVADLLAGAVALAHPSVDEGFGFTPLEAMAAGVPAIAADAGSLPEVTGGAATLVPPTDVDAWAAALATAATEERTDPAARAARVEAGRAWAATCTWARCAAAIAEVHDAVLTGSRQPPRR